MKIHNHAKNTDVDSITKCFNLYEKKMYHIAFFILHDSYQAEKNYITNFAAGDTREVHIAWLVPADETDQLYLNLGDNWQEFNQSDLDLGYVELSINR